MKLSTNADYAVRAVYELARHEPGEVVQTHTIALAQGIPESYLTKVLQQLARAGVVHTLRGNHGGVMLARPAGEISVCEVFEAIEGPVRLRRCRQRAMPCGDERCGTHDLWSTIESLLSRELQNVSFAALAADASKQGGRLAAPATSGR
jgi:Rrf2 family transcriptional regulator, iron-sulfur cluster assembly transcription factor